MDLNFKMRYQDYTINELKTIIKELKFELQNENNINIDYLKEKLENLELLLNEKINKIKNNKSENVINSNEDEGNYLTRICKLLDISKDDINANSKKLDNLKATYYFNPIRGGKCIIVSEDGSYLLATSYINYHKYLQDFRNGFRNGSFSEKSSIDDGMNPSIALIEAEKLMFNTPKNLIKAKDLLLSIVSKIAKYKNTLDKYYFSFCDVVEFALYSSIYKPSKEIIWVKTPFTKAYTYLSYIYNELGDYSSAINMADLAIKWDEFNVSALFEKCDSYKRLKNAGRFKELLDTIYDKIYDIKDLARYYRTVAYYNVEIKNYEIAYALYLFSLKYQDNKNAKKMIEYIDEILNRNYYSMAENDILNIMKKNGIPIGPNRKNITRLISLYEDNLFDNPKNEAVLASKLYSLTKDKKYAPFFEKIDKETGISILIPRGWTEYKNSKNAIFTYQTLNGCIFSVNNLGKCSNNDFAEKYKDTINSYNIFKDIIFDLVLEKDLKLKLVQDEKLFKMAIFNIRINERLIKMVYYYTIINNYMISFSINLDNNLDINNANFKNQINLQDITFILQNIYEIC